MIFDIGIITTRRASRFDQFNVEEVVPLAWVSRPWFIGNFEISTFKVGDYVKAWVWHFCCIPMAITLYNHFALSLGARCDDEYRTMASTIQVGVALRRLQHSVIGAEQLASPQPEHAFITDEPAGRQRSAKFPKVNHFIYTP